MGPHLDAAANTAAVSFVGVATIDTDSEVISDDTGTVILSTTVDTSGPVEIFVLRVKSLTAGDIVVSGSRALAIVSAEDIRLSGGLDNSAQGSLAGGGGLDDVSTCGDREGNGSEANWTGGAGGAYGGRGGGGGRVLGYTGPDATAVNGNASLVPLRGGCAGGGSGTNAGPASRGGGGGGALQIVSGSAIMITASGHIAASGGGSVGWPADTFCITSSTPCYPGAGGGAGGSLLLEALSVQVDSSAGLFANGGSGSCSLGGSDGLLSADAALGENCDYEYRGNGGRGNLQAFPNASSGGGLNTTGRGGGGGGGAGRIRINLPIGASTAAIEGTLSPTPSYGAVGTR